MAESVPLRGESVFVQKSENNCNIGEEENKKHNAAGKKMESS
jgi:hypothetical protein